MPYKDPLEREAAVERQADSQFKKLQKDHPDLIERCGEANVQSDLRMSVAMSLPLDEETEAERAPELERQQQELVSAQEQGLDLEALSDPQEQARRLLNPEPLEG